MSDLSREIQQLGLSELSAEAMIEACSTHVYRPFCCPLCDGDERDAAGMRCKACGGYGYLSEREWEALGSLRWPVRRQAPARSSWLLWAVLWLLAGCLAVGVLWGVWR